MAQAPAEPASKARRSKKAPASKAPRSKKAPPPAKRAATPPAKSAAKIGKKTQAGKSKAPAAAPADPTGAGAAKGLRREWHWTSSDARSNTAAGDAAQYVISETDGVWHCTCKGWRFLGQAKKAAGQSCHHIRAAKGIGEYVDVGPLPPDAEYEIAAKKPKSAPRSKAGGAGGSDLSSLPPAGLPSGGEDAVAASTEIFEKMTIDQIKHQLREFGRLDVGETSIVTRRSHPCARTTRPSNSYSVRSPSPSCPQAEPAPQRHQGRAGRARRRLPRVGPPAALPGVRRRQAQGFHCLPLCSLLPSLSSSTPPPPSLPRSLAKVSYHNGSDPSGGQTFKCPGFYDEDHFHFCSFSSTDVERPAWVDQPMAAKKATSAKPMPVD